MTDFSITSAEEQEIQAHAMREYPKEACGVLTPDGYRPLINCHPEPQKNFDCGDAVAELVIKDLVRAVVHSHVDRNLGPSSADIIQQQAMNIPWGITLTDGESAWKPYFWGDMIPPPPLIGRKFRHGPSGTDGRGDCYALIRDFYRMELGIRLVEGPRDDVWWENGQDLYNDNFERAGFVISPDGARNPQRGDVLLIHESGPVAHHAGVYVGGGLFIHHLSNRLSRKEPTGPYLPVIERWLRYVGKKP